MKNIVTFTRNVPRDSVSAYLNAGWATLQVTSDASKLEMLPMYRDLQTSGEECTVSVDLQAPLHIQRARILRPLGAHQGLRLSQAVGYDYMGNSHFEFGAIALTMRMIQAMYPLCKTHVCEPLSKSIGDRKFNLRAFGNFDTDAQLEEYMQYIKEIQDNKRRLEENPRIDLTINDTFAPDVWVDLNNAVILSYDKQFMSRLQSHLMATFQYMDAPVVKEEHHA